MTQDYKQVLKFWYEDHTPEFWYAKDDAFDKKIRDNFLDIHTLASKDELQDWHETIEGKLAKVIVLDQFSRNLYRNDPRSFASDDLALSIARGAVKNGEDRPLNNDQKQFLYMPYMHSESLEAHDEAVKLFETIAKPMTLEYEHMHRDIIVKFGRYPHRNAILGRESTPEEIEFLKTPDSSF